PARNLPRDRQESGVTGARHPTRAAPRSPGIHDRGGDVVTDVEEQNLIAALRSAGHREPGVPVTPVSQTLRRGRAARRRRTVVAATGGATVVAGIVTAAIALPPVLIAEGPRPAPAAPSTESTPSHQPTPEPDLPTSPREQGAANRQAVLDALPE